MSSIDTTEEILQEKEFSPMKVAMYSSLGQWVTDMIMYPLETISNKIKANTKNFLTFKQGYQLVISQGGTRSLFNGFNSTFPTTFIPAVVYFASYEQMNKMGMDKIKEVKNQDVSTGLKLMMPLLTSTISQVLCLLFYLPFDVVRTRMQVNEEFKYKSVTSGIRDVVQKEGFLRFYKSSHSYIAFTSLQTGLLFWFYECQRYFLLHDKKSRDHQLTFNQSMLVSFSSSLLSTFIINPFDLVLTRFQVIDSRKQSLSMVLITKEIIKNEGYIAFFKGLNARLYISCAYSMIFMPIYEHFKSRYGVDISENY